MNSLPLPLPLFGYTKMDPVLEILADSKQKFVLFTKRINFGAMH